MIIDLSIPISMKTSNEAAKNEKLANFGHLGTHFDVMNKVFPLDFTKRKAIVFNVDGLMEISTSDINLNLIKRDMFIAFYTGFIDKVDYGSKEYFTDHPQLSTELIKKLINKNISIIGIDFAGVRRGVEHTPTDKKCAEKGLFIVENLYNLSKVLNGQENKTFTANTYPVNFIGMSGLPCRVTAEI